MYRHKTAKIKRTTLGQLCRISLSVTLIKLLHLDLIRYSIKLGKSDSKSILFDESKVPNAMSNQIHLSSFICGQVQSRNNRYIIIGELKLLSSNLANLHCYCFLPPLPILIRGFLVINILCQIMRLKLSSLDTSWKTYS